MNNLAVFIGVVLSFSLVSQGLHISTNPKKTEAGEDVISKMIYLPEDTMFCDESEVQYYAYMDLNSADETLRPRILQARNIIISSSSWVADGVNGYVEDRETGEIKTLPQFSEVFPSDWEMPIYSTNEEELVVDQR